MEYIGENLAKGLRIKPSEVVVHKSEARGHHWRHIRHQTDLRNQRLRLIERKKWKGDHMQLLSNAPKLNEGRGRKVTNSTFNVESLLEATGTDNLGDAVVKIIELGSPFISASAENGDWTGTKSGAIKNLTKVVSEVTDGVAGVSRRTKGETKDTIQVTFHLKAQAEPSEEE